MEFQHVRKTQKKTIVPCVVGGDWKWQVTVVGLLIAGELYINLTGGAGHGGESLNELIERTQAAVAPPAVSTAITKNAKKEDDFDVMVSYCWSNSQIARNLDQVHANVDIFCVLVIALQRFATSICSWKNCLNHSWLTGERVSW